jgi:hypothetical protein
VRGHELGVARGGAGGDEEVKDDMGISSALCGRRWDGLGKISVSARRSTHTTLDIVDAHVTFDKCALQAEWAGYFFIFLLGDFISRPRVAVVLY